MKILYIVSSFPRHEGDPEVPWLVEAIRRLKKKGFDIEVLAPSFRGLPPHSVYGIKVFRYRYFLKKYENLTHEQGMPNKIKNPFYFLMFFFYLIFGLAATIKLCRKNNYTLIHAHWPFPHAIHGLIAARICKAKLVLTFYVAELLLVKNKFSFLKPLLKKLIEKADLTICISSFTANLVKEITPTKVKVIPYGAVVEEKKYAKKSGREKIIIFVGRLIERKGINYLIKAMPYVLAKEKAKLIIVGDGDQKENLQRLTKNLGLEKTATFTGKVSDEKLNSIYQQCDVFVLPSIFDSKGDTEGLGVVLLEALAYKKPVVASNVGGIVDVVINNKTGLLVPQKDSEALAAAILKILKNKKLATRLGNEGYLYAKKKFDWNKIIQELQKEYERLK